MKIERQIIVTSNEISYGMDNKIISATLDASFTGSDGGDIRGLDNSKLGARYGDVLKITIETSKTERAK